MSSIHRQPRRQSRSSATPAADMIVLQRGAFIASHATNAQTAIANRYVAKRSIENGRRRSRRIHRHQRGQPQRKAQHRQRHAAAATPPAAPATPARRPPPATRSSASARVSSAGSQWSETPPRSSGAASTARRRFRAIAPRGGNRSSNQIKRREGYGHPGRRIAAARTLQHQVERRETQAPRSPAAATASASPSQPACELPAFRAHAYQPRRPGKNQEEHARKNVVVPNSLES